MKNCRPDSKSAIVAVKESEWVKIVRNEWKGKCDRSGMEITTVFSNGLNNPTCIKLRGQEVIPNVMAHSRNKKLISKNAVEDVASRVWKKTYDDEV